MTGNSIQIENALIKLLDEAESYLSQNEAALVYICYSLASSYTNDPKYGLDEVFLLQSLGTAYDLAHLRLSAEFVAGALLYHPVSADAISIKQVSELEESVALVVQKLLEIGNLFEQYLPWKQTTTKGKKLKVSVLPKKPIWAERTAENSSCAILALAQIPEIAVVKLVNRLHLLKESGGLFDDKSLQMLAQETLNVHAIVAERLGIWSIKWQLDDAAFKILKPDDYQAIRRDLNEQRQEREGAIKRAIEILRKALDAEGLSHAEISGRPKHIYGLYLKMKQLGQSVREVNDNLGLRILVNTKAECYQAVDILHRTWPRAEGIYGDKLYRDWIPSPKPNQYQSIHATVKFTEDRNRLLEVQIRTHEMHEMAEYGIASHWIYRKAGSSIKLQSKYQKYVAGMAELRQSFEKRQRKAG